MDSVFTSQHNVLYTVRYRNTAMTYPIPASERARPDVSRLMSMKLLLHAHSNSFLKLALRGLGKKCRVRFTGQVTPQAGRQAHNVAEKAGKLGFITDDAKRSSLCKPGGMERSIPSQRTETSTGTALKRGNSPMKPGLRSQGKRLLPVLNVIIRTAPSTDVLSWQMTPWSPQSVPSWIFPPARDCGSSSTPAPVRTPAQWKTW